MFLSLQLRWRRGDAEYARDTGPQHFGHALVQWGRGGGRGEGSQKGPGERARRRAERSTLAIAGQERTVIAACKIVPVFRRAIDSLRARAQPARVPFVASPRTHPTACMSPWMFSRAPRRAKRIAGYACTFVPHFSDVARMAGRNATFLVAGCSVSAEYRLQCPLRICVRRARVYHYRVDWQRLN